MRKTLLCSAAIGSAALALMALAWTFPASGADLQLKATPVPPYTMDPWTGFYLGLNGGYGFNLGSAAAAFEAVPFESLKTAPQGFLVGGHVGYGQRLNQYLYLGIEGSADIANLTGDGSTMLGFVTMTSKNQWLGDVSARFGFIPVGHAMIYGRVGYGFGGGEFTVTDLIAGQTASANPTLGGLMWGGGLEVPFSANWLGRVEYKQYDFGTISVTTPSLTTFTMKDRVDTITAGLSYKF